MGLSHQGSNSREREIPSDHGFVAFQQYACKGRRWHINAREVLRRDVSDAANVALHESSVTKQGDVSDINQSAICRKFINAF
jgi:hypothetical protein